MTIIVAMEEIMTNNGFSEQYNIESTVLPVLRGTLCRQPTSMFNPSSNQIVSIILLPMVTIIIIVGE